MSKKVYDFYEKAKSISYGRKRLKSDILGIVIHYTGNKNDTAKNNVYFFSKKYGSNTRSAGAHFFIDRLGYIGRSIPMNLTAWSVGNPNNCYQHGVLYNVLDNSNTVSIELCDIVDQFPSEIQIERLKELIIYIKKYCPNVNYVCRHYDIVNKMCPDIYVKNPNAWKKLQNELLKLIKE